MVMVIGSSHSTLKDTLPTVRKIEKSQNLNIFQLRYALLLEQPFHIPFEIPFSANQLHNDDVISMKNSYFLCYDLLLVIDNQIQVHNTCKMAYHEFGIRFWNIHPTSRIRNLQTIR